MNVQKVFGFKIVNGKTRCPNCGNMVAVLPLRNGVQTSIDAPLALAHHNITNIDPDKRNHVCSRSHRTLQDMAIDR